MERDVAIERQAFVACRATVHAHVPSRRFLDYDGDLYVLVEETLCLKTKLQRDRTYVFLRCQDFLYTDNRKFIGPILHADSLIPAEIERERVGVETLNVPVGSERPGNR